MTWFDELNKVLSGPLGLWVGGGIALLILFVWGLKAGLSLGGFGAGLGRFLASIIDKVGDALWERVWKAILYLIVIFGVVPIIGSILITQLNGGPTDIWYIYRTFLDLLKMFNFI